ncbi:lanthionine synthetase LanC family protein [Streptosporangium lutulentum]
MRRPPGRDRSTATARCRLAGRDIVLPAPHRLLARGRRIGWALSRFAATPDGATAGARYAETARAAFAYERDLYDPRVRNWPDYRDIPGERADDTAPASMQAWCHGAPGIGLARADLLRRGSPTVSRPTPRR